MLVQLSFENFALLLVCFSVQSSILHKHVITLPVLAPPPLKIPLSGEDLQGWS